MWGQGLGGLGHSGGPGKRREREENRMYQGDEWANSSRLGPRRSGSKGQRHTLPKQERRDVRPGVPSVKEMGCFYRVPVCEKKRVGNR